MPSTLVKDYSVTLFNKGEKVKTLEINDNIYRFNRIDFDNKCDKIEINCKSTYGNENIRIFEVRAY